ncbi:GNAT family N-acetyltransferase [Candidatus Bathyarchaeota archaeon]|nr:GNAT family N-acetyltransferase [Candidatus Bathyarchaeota archaeon]
MNLRIFEDEDLDFLYKWNNDVEYVGKYESFKKMSRENLMMRLNSVVGLTWYIIETKQGFRVGQLISRLKEDNSLNIGYRVIPSARNKGYCSDAVKTFVNYVFKNKVALKITAGVHPDNVASRKILEKTGFKMIGFDNNSVEINGVLVKGALYEIMLEDWQNKL